MSGIQLTHSGPESGGNYECEWANGYLQAHFISDIGKKRKSNEDSCLLCAPEDDALLDERGVLFAIADGMGGASAGECASRLALDTVTEEFYTGSISSIPDQLRESCELSNERVFYEAKHNPARHGMGTTLSAVLVLKDCVYVAQVGDSRVYLSRDKQDLFQITDDHSLVAEQVRSGIISEEEARNHSMRNLITRAIGIKEAVDVDLFSFKVQRGDTLMICSDGLCNLVNDESIAATLELSNLQGAARILVGKALEGGGTDNISVALIRIVDTPPQGNLEEGAQHISFPSAGLFGKLKRFLT